MNPPWVPIILTGALLYEIEVLNSKNFPVINAPKLDIIGIKPFNAKPVAIPRPFASAIPASKDLFGNALKIL